MKAVRALVGGLGTVLSAPMLVVAAVIVMLLITAPFAAIVGVQLQHALADQQPISRDAGEIDPEWWFDYRQHARGLMETFTPAIIGFAAPLDNLSAIMDGTSRPIVMAGPYLAAVIAWSFLWGAALDRYAHGRRRAFLTSGAATFGRFFVISLMAAAAVLILYATMHRLLIGLLAPTLEASASSERNAFFWRLACYLVFGAMLAAISLVADYARVSIVFGRSITALGAVTHASRFVRANAGSVFALYALTGVLFAVVFAGYGILDTYGGSRVGGWRGIAIAQAYIVARLIIRLTFGASEVRLYRNSTV